MCNSMLVIRMVDSRMMLVFEQLKGLVGKLRGLLGPRERGRPVVLVGCRSVHTFGMRYAIDVALVSRSGKVLASRRSMPPGRVLSASGAWFAFERPSAKGPWPQEGSWLSVAECGGEWMQRLREVGDV